MTDKLQILIYFYIPDVPSDNSKMDMPPIEKPHNEGCGHADPEWNKPKILTHPKLEEDDRIIICGQPIPDDEKIDITSLPGGCGGRIDLKPEDFILKAQQEKLINEEFIQATFDTSEAASPNAQANLDKKLRGLGKAQENAVRTEILPDGRIRYYDIEKESKTPGPTRGASFVTEYNPSTGQVRSWYECYDQDGNVNRIHPKTLNGQDLIAQHYPPTKLELESFQKD